MRGETMMVLPARGFPGRAVHTMSKTYAANPKSVSVSYGAFIQRPKNVGFLRCSNPYRIS